MTPPLSPETTTAPWRQRRVELYSVIAVVAFIGVFGIATVVTGGSGHLVQLARAHGAVIAGLLGLSLVNYGARALRWHLFSRGAEVHVPIGRNALYFISGFAMTVTPGKIGEVLRLWLLRRHHGYAYAQTTPILVADRLSDLAVILLLCFASVTAFTGFLPVLAGVMAGLAAMALLLLRPSFLLRGIGALQRRAGRLRRMLELAETALRYARRLHSRRTYAVTLPIAGAGWLAEALAFYWLLLTLGADVSLLQAIFVFAFAMLVGALAVLPGGLGGTEATMSALLAALGVDLGIAFVATAVIRTTTLWFAVVLGFIVLPLALRSPRPSPALGT